MLSSITSPWHFDGMRYIYIGWLVSILARYSFDIATPCPLVPATQGKYADEEADCSP